MSEVWVVYKIYENEGESIHAICSSEEQAKRARDKVAALNSEYREHFKIRKVSLDFAYPYGLLDESTKEAVS